MGFWIPALLLGGVGASHHYANKELDMIVKEVDQPIFGFWWGISFGIVGGVCVGIHFQSTFLRAFHWIEWIISLGDFQSKKKLDQEKLVPVTQP